MIVDRIRSGVLAGVTASIFLVYSIAGPVTYILNVVDTWKGHASVVIKIFLNLTLDALLAFIWPITWVCWVPLHLLGRNTPLQLLFG
jgi:hypothetical protein